MGLAPGPVSAGAQHPQGLTATDCEERVSPLDAPVSWYTPYLRLFSCATKATEGVDDTALVAYVASVARCI